MNPTLSFVFALALPVSPIVLVGAGLILAIVIFVAAILLFRSGGKKKNAATDAAATGSSWQPQGQPGAPGAWNQQAAGAANPNPWGQPNQQQGGWGAGAPGAGQPGQAANANPWGAQGGAQQPQQAGWGQSSPQQPGWGGAPALNQQSANPWGAQNGAQQPQQAGWGQSSPQQPGWDQAPVQAAQDPWAQQQAPQAQQAPGQSASPWSTPGNTPAQPQTAFGAAPSGPSWGQPANQPAFGGAPVPAEQWGAPAAQQQYQGVGGPAAGAVPGMPAWQQGGYAQPGADNDRTILRSAGPQTGLGIVSVEEGKEPGRVYEVRKESLSIGRSRESDIFLEDLAVSRLHASILNMGNGNYALKDEGSANGTKVNGQLVNKYQTYPLQEGDRIQLGQTVLVFSRR